MSQKPVNGKKTKRWTAIEMVQYNKNRSKEN